MDLAEFRRRLENSPRALEDRKPPPYHEEAEEINLADNSPTPVTVVSASPGSRVRDRASSSNETVFAEPLQRESPPEKMARSYSPMDITGSLPAAPVEEYVAPAPEQPDCPSMDAHMITNRLLDLQDQIQHIETYMVDSFQRDEQKYDNHIQQLHRRVEVMERGTMEQVGSTEFNYILETIAELGVKVKNVTEMVHTSLAQREFDDQEERRRRETTSSTIAMLQTHSTEWQESLTQEIRRIASRITEVERKPMNLDGEPHGLAEVFTRLEQIEAEWLAFKEFVVGKLQRLEEQILAHPMEERRIAALVETRLQEMQQTVQRRQVEWEKSQTTNLQQLALQIAALTPKMTEVQQDQGSLREILKIMDSRISQEPAAADTGALVQLHREHQGQAREIAKLRGTLENLRDGYIALLSKVERRGRSAESKGKRRAHSAHSAEEREAIHSLMSLQSVLPDVSGNRPTVPTLTWDDQPNQRVLPTILRATDGLPPTGDKTSLRMPQTGVHFDPNWPQQLSTPEKNEGNMDFIQNYVKQQVAQAMGTQIGREVRPSPPRVPSPPRSETSTLHELKVNASGKKLTVKVPTRCGMDSGMAAPWTAGASAPPSEAAAIHAIAGASAAGMHPFMFAWGTPHGMSLLTAAPKPKKFTGKSLDWQSFVRDWKIYEKLIEGAYPIHLWDASKLQALESLMDSTTRTEMTSQKQRNPDLKFTDFWAYLERTFASDTAYQSKSDWKSVQLQLYNGQLTADNWRAFVTEYRAKRQWVKDCAESEETALIFQQLNDHWNQEITREEARLNAKGYWSQIDNTDKHTAAEMQRILEGLEIDFRKVIVWGDGFKVLHDAEEDREKLLTLEGTQVGEGRPWRISRSRIRMTAEQIFKFVTDRLQCREEAHDRKRIIGGQHEIRAYPVVNSIETAAEEDVSLEGNQGDKKTTMIGSNKSATPNRSGSQEWGVEDHADSSVSVPNKGSPWKSQLVDSTRGPSGGSTWQSQRAGSAGTQNKGSSWKSQDSGSNRTPGKGNTWQSQNGGGKGGQGKGKGRGDQVENKNRFGSPPLSGPQGGASNPAADGRQPYYPFTTREEREARAKEAGKGDRTGGQSAGQKGQALRTQ